jgi:chromosome segregation protein
MIYPALMKYFDGDVALKNTKVSFDEGLTRLGKNPNTASARDIEKVLKSNVYKQLQVALPPASAKALVQKALDELQKLEKQFGSDAPPQKDPALERQAEGLSKLEDGLKRFNLYFDWAEVSKFKSQLHVIKEQQLAGKLVPDLLRDAQNQLGALERKLQDLLVRQAQDIAELQTGFEKVKSIGGPRVKRLEGVISQIVEAQQEQTLAAGEVERARKLVLELRKLIESSVVNLPPVVKNPTVLPSTVSQIKLPESSEDDAIVIDDSVMQPRSQLTAPDVVEVEGLDDSLNIDLDFPELELSPEQSERVKDIELAEDARLLEGIRNEFAALLELDAALKAEYENLERQNLERVVQAEAIQALRPSLEISFNATLVEQQQRLAGLTQTLPRFAELDTSQANMTAQIASGMLQAGTLASEELRKIEDLMRAFERQLEQLEQQKAEEAERLERSLSRQANLIGEMQGALSTFAPLGAVQNAKLSQFLTELEMATQLRQPREDLSKALTEELTRLQGELESFEAQKRAEEAQRAEQVRQKAEAERRAEEARQEALRLEAARLERERIQALERAEAERLEHERLERERVAAVERERQRQEAERMAAEERERERQEAERRALVAREGGMLRAMRLSLAALPDLPELASEHAALEAQLGLSAKQLEAGMPITTNLEGFKLGLEHLGKRARQVYVQRLGEFERRAQELEAFSLLDTIAAAKEGLELGNFPDLAAFETELRSQREARLEAQRRELTDLEGAVRDFVGNPQSVPLQTQIAAARGRHESGVLTNLASLWDELENLRVTEENAVVAWRSRAETVMRDVNQYRQMGGETVRQLLRLSTVLAAEPGTRLTPETRLKLERTLEEAERLLQIARQEAEAANAVAAALRDVGQIDDLLGIFGGDSQAMQQAASEAKISPSEASVSPTPVVVAPVSHSLAANWVAEVSKERGVAGAALIAASGQLQAGSIHEPDKIATLLLEMDKYQRELAKELERRPARICTVEQSGSTLLAVFLAGELETKHFITVKIDDVAVMSRIFANAQRDFEGLKNWSQSA